MNIQLGKRSVEISQREPQGRNLRARELDHESVFVICVVSRTAYVLARTLKQLSQQE
jgi:hypothetical protein